MAGISRKRQVTDGNMHSNIRMDSRIVSFLQLIRHIICNSAETDRRTKNVNSKNRYLEATYCLQDMGRLKKYCFCFRP